MHNLEPIIAGWKKFLKMFTENPLFESKYKYAPIADSTQYRLTDPRMKPCFFTS